MKDFYISFEEQGWGEPVVKVKAETEDEAILKAAYFLFAMNHDVCIHDTKEQAFAYAEVADVPVYDEASGEELWEDGED